MSQTQVQVNVERYQQNINVLRQLRAGQASKELLKTYSGWGGLREAVYTPEVYRELKKVLSDADIRCLKQTLPNAYYTPPELVKFIYAWLERYGFKGGNILEPAVGHGVFLEHMPAGIKANSHTTAVELDNITSAIVKRLYSNIELHHCPFEQFQPQRQFDLIIGNPPYGANTVQDPQHADLNNYCIHHYFVAKSMRLLKNGGILAMVLPSYFLDNVTKHVRYLVQREGGTLIAAYRLPDNLFNDAKVTVDIVFLRKGGEKEDWARTRDISLEGQRVPLNVYFHRNPQNVLGTLTLTNAHGCKQLTCRRQSDDVLDQLFCRLPATPETTNTRNNIMHTPAPTFTEEEAFLLHSLVIKNKADVIKFARENHFATIDTTGHIQKLEALEKKLIALVGTKK